MLRTMVTMVTGWTGHGAVRRVAAGLAAVAMACALLAAPAVAQDAGTGAAVESLLANGRLQEAAWALRASGDTARADEVLDRLAGILRSWPESARPLSMDSQGVSYTWRLDHGQGVESIFKVDGSDIFCPACGADREVASYRIDALLGFDLTPMTVFARIANQQGDTLSGSTMYFVDGARSPGAAGVTKPDALRFFDAVIGNSDRHADNWLLVGDRVVAIDHNRAFEWQPTTRATTCWESEIDSIAEPGELGGPWQRYRTLPADSIRAALAGIDTALVRRFLDMRPRVEARIQARIDGSGPVPLDDCAPRR